MAIDNELERLKGMAQRYADQDGKRHCVINLNRVGNRMLVVREWHESFDAKGAGFVVVNIEPTRVNGKAQT